MKADQKPTANSATVPRTMANWISVQDLANLESNIRILLGWLPSQILLPEATGSRLLSRPLVERMMAGIRRWLMASISLRHEARGKTGKSTTLSSRALKSRIKLHRNHHTRHSLCMGGSAVDRDGARMGSNASMLQSPHSPSSSWLSDRPR